MDMSGIAISLLFMVVVPTIIGVILNEASRQRLPVMVSPYLDPGAKVCLMLVIAANAAAVAPGVRLDDPLIWKTALVVILLTIAGLSIVKLVSVIGKCRAEKGITMIISGGLRNNSAVMTIAVTFFPEAAALPTLLSIVFQQTIAALMGRLLVGRKSEERKVKNEK
jgi:predicted Na+-dependent transporter